MHKMAGIAHESSIAPLDTKKKALNRILIPI